MSVHQQPTRTHVDVIETVNAMKRLGSVQPTISTNRMQDPSLDLLRTECLEYFEKHSDRVHLCQKLQTKSGTCKVCYLHCAIGTELAKQLEDTEKKTTQNIRYPAPHAVKNFVFGYIAANQALMETLPPQFLGNGIEPLVAVNVVIIKSKVEQSETKLSPHFAGPEGSISLVLPVVGTQKLTINQKTYDLPPGTVYRFPASLVQHSVQYYLKQDPEDERNFLNISIIMRVGGGALSPLNANYTKGLAMAGLKFCEFSRSDVIPLFETLSGVTGPVQDSAAGVLASILGPLPASTCVPTLTNYTSFISGGNGEFGTSLAMVNGWRVAVGVKFPTVNTKHAGHLAMFQKTVLKEFFTIQTLSKLGLVQIPKCFGIVVHPDRPLMTGFAMEFLPLNLDDVRRWKVPQDVRKMELAGVQFVPLHREKQKVYLWIVTQWIEALNAMHACG
jgi:hypothetical protein